MVVCPWSAENPRHDHQLVFQLSNNRLMLVWSQYYADRPSFSDRTPLEGKGFLDDFPCRLAGKISRDRGRSWGETFILQENLWGRNVKHPNLMRLDSGEILFSFTGWQEPRGQRNVFMKRSADECETWTEMVQLTEPGWYCNNNDHAIRLSSGRLLIPAHGKEGDRFDWDREDWDKMRSFVIYSDDGFRTWRVSADRMSASGKASHEPSIVELRDGRLLCFLRTECRCIYRSYSEDGGDHWIEPEPTDIPAPSSPSLLKRIPATGDLILIWNNVASEASRPRTPLSAAISRDEGESWECVKDIDNRSDFDAAYAAVFFQGDEAIVTYYTRDTSWSRDTEITLKIYEIGQFYE
jgi:sialidase-1